MIIFAQLHVMGLTIIFLIVTVNMEYHIIDAAGHHILIYTYSLLMTLLFRFRSFLLNLFLLIFAVNCSWFLCMSAFQGEFGVGECAVLYNCLIMTSTCIFDLASELESSLKSSTGTRIFNWDLCLQLELRSSTGTWIFNWDTDL